MLEEKQLNKEDIFPDFISSSWTQDPSDLPPGDELEMICNTIVHHSQQEDDARSVWLDEEDVGFLKKLRVVDEDCHPDSDPESSQDIETECEDNYSSGEDSLKQKHFTTLPSFSELYHPTRSVTSEEREEINNIWESLGSPSGEEEDMFDKPYCKSKRGAKNVLLWKFLLQTLEQRPDLLKWIDEQRGVFKFVDTSTISKMWGMKKSRGDMNFEKLSRGIRHYYKSGLMTRKEGTRLVYQFHWHRVPRAYRKC